MRMHGGSRRVDNEVCEWIDISTKPGFAQDCSVSKIRSRFKWYQKYGHKVLEGIQERRPDIGLTWTMDISLGNPEDISTSMISNEIHLK